MSNSVDNRVVQMKFDNAEFEKNVQTSMTTLNKLNKSLEMTEATKGLDDVNTAASRTDLSGLSGGVDALRVKFSALQIMAVTALSNITNSALDAGKRITSALTIDPIKTGFHEYETQINAVQTILANTQSKGSTLTDVNKALDQLNTYADKTIYNFTEMARNIGTFTAAGVNLDTSVNAIKGIANLAAVSGSNAEQASTAMYQLSQAMASGTVKLMDWNSVVNAGMGGQVFQDALKETAKVHGISVEKMIKEEGSFRETLQYGWLSTDILTETLSKFTGDLSESQLKSMGYSDEQIKSIVKLGQTANDAATKVKTFTQLFDTLKEAAQSGWTQSWEIIIGDFEEAKTLLTSLSDTFGAIIGASSNARNAMLENWKELGGRNSLIEAAKNSFNAILSVIKPIKEAFREIFPPMTGKQLYAITEGFAKLTSCFVLNEQQGANLKATFKGIFSVISLFGKAISIVVQLIAPLGDLIGYLGSNLLSVSGMMGRFTSGLTLSVDSFSFISDALTMVVNGIKSVIETLKANISIPSLDAIKNTINSLIINITTFKDAAVSAFSDVKAGATDSLDSANDRFDRFYNSIINIKEGLSNFGAKVKEALGPTADQIKAAFSDVTITDAIGTGMITAIILTIRKLMKNINGITKSFDDIMNSVVGVLDGTRDALKTWQTSIKADTLLKIAGAVALLTVSLIALSFVDPEKMKVGLVGVTTLLTEVVATMKILDKMQISGIAGAAASMILVAIAVSILAGALAKLKDFQSWDATWPAITAMSSLILGLTVAMKVMSKSMKGMDGGEFTKAMFGVILMAVAINLLVAAMKTVADMNPKEIAKGLISVGVLLAGITAFVKFSDFSGMAGSGIIILEIALALLVLYEAVSLFGKMDWKVLAQGLLTITGLIITLSLAVRAMGEVNIVGASSAIMSMAIALTLLTIPIKILGAMKFAELAQGLLGIGVALGLMMGAMAFLEKGNFKTVGANMVLMAIGLNLLVIPIKVLGSMPWQALALGLGAVFVALAMFVGVSLLLEPLGIGLLVVAGAFALFGLAAMAVGVGLAQLAIGFVTFAAIGVVGATTIIATITALIIGLGALIPKIAVMLADGIVSFVKALSLAAPILFKAIAIIMFTLLKTIQDVAPAIMETVGILLVKLLQTIAKYTPDFVEAGFKIIIAFIQGIANNMQTIVEIGIQTMANFLNGVANQLPTLIQAGVNVMVAFIQGIASASVQLVEAAYTAMITFINGLALCIEQNTPLLTAAITRLITAIINAAIAVLVASIAPIRDKGKAIMESGFIQGIKEKIDGAKTVIGDVIGGMLTAIGNNIQGFVEAGKNVIDGFIQGIKDKFEDAVNTASDLGEKILDSAKSALGIHSPSREFAEIGKYSALGLVQGLKQYAYTAYEAATDVANGMLDAMKSPFNNISNVIDGNFNLNPVITPTLDLSNVTTGAKEISSMFNNQRLAVSGEVDQNGGTSQSGNEFQFIQNNYSPKALSRTEIYRQTNNQLSMMKGAMNRK